MEPDNREKVTIFPPHQNAYQPSKPIAMEQFEVEFEADKIAWRQVSVGPSEHGVGRWSVPLRRRRCLPILVHVGQFSAKKSQ